MFLHEFENLIITVNPYSLYPNKNIKEIIKKRQNSPTCQYYEENSHIIAKTQTECIGSSTIMLTHKTEILRKDGMRIVT